MLLAAGFAPSFPAAGLGDDQLSPVREALQHLLTGQLPRMLRPLRDVNAGDEGPLPALPGAGGGG